LSSALLGCSASTPNFHHGHPARRDLLVRERRAWVEGLELPHAARTQIEVALSLIDQVNAQLAASRDDP
jgi:hypothetical protein